MAIETSGEKRNLNLNINAQQAILNAYISNNSMLKSLAGHYLILTFRSSNCIFVEGYKFYLALLNVNCIIAIYIANNFEPFNS